MGSLKDRLFKKLPNISPAIKTKIKLNKIKNL
jgi:hypothetical protein